jgi:tetraacyldisaccharide 4'-kinase
MRAPDFWSRNDWRARALSPLGWIYGASVAWKAQHAKPFRPSAAVICVGNLTAGGSGKTPVAIAVADMLRARGRTPFFLTRGYGGRLHGPILVGDGNTARDVGDEPLLLRRAAPVVVARDRVAGAHLAQAHGADVIIMDDGHQNFGLVKDLSLVVVDGETGFGNGHILPAGPLREPVGQGLARADAVVIVGDGTPSLNGFPRSVLRASLVQCGPEPHHGRVVAFAGIGRPEKFFRALEAGGAQLAATKGYADHHAYTSSEIARLKSKARSCDALLVTTEKDFVRLTPAEREGIHAVPVRAAFDETMEIERLLDSLPAKR